MPLSRHRVANEYSLGGRDLYKGADQHDPEAVLDGVAMAGLVGVLRQLGDLAELSAQVFHGLYDEVMTVSARGHGLVLRVQQLEAELSLVEKDISQRDYLYVASNRGVDWHANPRVDHGVVTRGDTPRFIMESIKQCHGPPRLFMLDKYDIGGEGTCLKRYTDPAFFKTDSACSSVLQEGIRRERRPLRAMFIHLRVCPYHPIIRNLNRSGVIQEIRPNLQNFEIFRPNAVNDDSKLGTGQSDEALDEVPTRRRQLKYRQVNGSLFQSFRPQLQNLYEKASSEEKPSSMDQSEVQISFTDSPDTTAEERDIMIDTSSRMDRDNNGHCATVRRNRSMSEEASSRASDAMSAGSSKGYNSEVDIYMDALTTVGSEVETDLENMDHRKHAFAPVLSGKTCSDAHGPSACMSSSFSEEDLPMPCPSDAGSANMDKVDHYEENATISAPQAKPVAGEHERTSSLEELFSQEKPVSCEHERTNSLEELLKGDVLASEPDMKESAKTYINGIFSNATPDDTVSSTKKAIATISLKKTASRRKYVGGMELLASKVGILPRKLSKRHDPFSDSLRNMAKELLELKCDGTQVTDLYDFEANGEECNMKLLELSHPRVEEDRVRQSVSSDSPQDDVSSREFHPEEENKDSDHDVPSTDSPQDSVHDDNDFQPANIDYLTDITSQSPREEKCDVAASDEQLSAGSLDHASKLIQEQMEDVHIKFVSENASDMGEELKEVCICEEQVNAEECGESDEYASDDENTEYIEEQVVLDGVVFSLISSEQSDGPCRISPLTLEDDKVPSEGVNNYTPEVEHIALMATITETDLPKVVIEPVIRSETAVPDNEQYYVHPGTSLAQDIVLGSCEVISHNEELQLCNSSVMAYTPDLTGNTTEIHELHQPVDQEPYASDDENTEYIEEQVVPDGVVSSLISSEQSDDPCQITPLTLTDDKVESEGANNYTSEMEHITLMETITESDLPIVVTEPLIRGEAPVPDNEQYYVHPETSFAQDGVLGSCEIVSQNKEVQLCSLSMMASTPDLTGNTEEVHELHQPVHQEPSSPCNRSNTGCFGDLLAPDSWDVPLLNISSFDWMLNGAMLQSLNVLPAKPTYGIRQGSSEDTGHAPPLPPLPPMQWRMAKLQTGSTALFAKLGRPPRPKPPVKQQGSECNSSLDETNEEAENLQEKTQYNGFIPQKEKAQTTVSNEVQTNPLLDMYGQENHPQEGCKEYDVQGSNLFSASEVKSVSDVASVEGDKHTLQVSELIVIPEETWSELVDIKPILQQEKERKQELVNGVSDCNGMHTAGLSSEMTNLECVRCNQKEKEFSVADRNTVTDSGESKPTGLPCQDDAQNPDLPVQQEDVEHGLSESGDKEREFSSALEEELAKLAPHPVPAPPRYPLLQVTSHDRSMLRKAPTLVQPSSSDENTMLEQIKNKSFSLKPVLAKRPNVMGGPRTNLQVVAILERANAIRQAVADDDDEDSWSE